MAKTVRAYAAARQDRLTEDWTANQTSANAEIYSGRRRVTDRTRQQERDNALMTSALSCFENNVIGPNGVDLQMNVQDPNGNLDKAANAMIEDAWFKAGQAKNCTVGKTLSRTMMLYQCIDSVVRDGGILFRKRPGAKNAFRYALQPLEIDHLDHDFNRDASATENKVRFGIEMDEFDAPLFYHIFTSHPGDIVGGLSMMTAGRRIWRERVPADEIIAVWDIRRRAGQVVGMPRFSSTLLSLHHLEQYDEAELVLSRMSACKGGFLYDELVPGEEYKGPKDEAGNTIEDVQPGMIQDIGMKRFQEYDPKHPTDAYAPFTKTQIRKFARGIGLSYMAISGDLSDTTFSSGRMGRQEDQREFRKLQWCVIVEQLLQPWFEDWLPYGIMSGQIRLPVAKIDKFNAASWQPQGWDWIQPKDDIEADKQAIAMGTKSRKQVIGERGGDITKIDAENFADKSVFPDGTDYSKAYLAPGQQSQPEPATPPAS